MRILRTIAVLAAMLTVACGRGQPPANETTGTAGTPAAGVEPPRVELGAAAQLDSGNAAYRAKDYRGALAHYQQAAQRAPRLAAAWFGIYMAKGQLGDKAGADSAMRMVQSIAPGTMGAHPAGGSSGGLPPGHPAVGAPAPGSSTPSGPPPSR